MILESTRTKRSWPAHSNETLSS